tara:strand:- start:625 stop:861 length:237 start_codon:yes stop_codon:yes gene_type:complete
MAKKKLKKKERKLQRTLVNINKQIEPNCFWRSKKEEISQLSEDLDCNLFDFLPDRVLKQLVTHGDYEAPTIGFKFEGK